MREDNGVLRLHHLDLGQGVPFVPIVIISKEREQRGDYNNKRGNSLSTTIIPRQKHAFCTTFAQQKNGFSTA